MTLLQKHEKNFNLLDSRMKVLYLKEHLSCTNYLSNTLNGFNRYTLKVNETFTLQENDLHFLFFFKTGKVEISCSEFDNRVYEGGTMLFLAKGNKIKGKIIKDTQFTLVSFEKHINLCDKAMLESLYIKQKVIGDRNYDGLPLRTGIKRVLDSVDYYLDNKLSCKHLHLLKLQEVFFILRAEYQKKELVQFFKPMLDQSVSFEDFVLANYKKVKTVEELAELYNCSQRTFNRYFQETFNDSPYNWILKQKSQRVKELLTTTKTPFKTIIEDFNFSSPSHFSTFCRAQFGVPPRDVRKRAQKVKNKVDSEK